MTKPLPNRAQAILRGEDGGYSPWSSVMTVAMSAMNVGWAEQQFTEAVMASDLSEEFATENGRNRPDRLAARLAKAWSRAESAWTPPLSDRNDVRKRLEALSQRLAEHRWLGRTASKDRAVAIALVAWADEVGVWTLDAGARELGLRAGVGSATAARALHRLAALGLISKDETSTRHSGHTQRWSLDMDWGTSDQTETHDLVPRGERFMCPTLTTSHPAFLGSALGHTAERVWLDLAEHPDATAAEVVERLSIGVQTVRRALTKKLLPNGLVVQAGTRTGNGRPTPFYRLNPEAPTLDSIAESFETLDWHERTAERHERERAGYREVQRHRAERTKAENANWSQEMGDAINKLMNPTHQHPTGGALLNFEESKTA